MRIGLLVYVSERLPLVVITNDQKTQVIKVVVFYVISEGVIESSRSWLQCAPNGYCWDARAAHPADWLASKQTKGSLIGLKLLLQFESASLFIRSLNSIMSRGNFWKLAWKHHYSVTHHFHTEDMECLCRVVWRASSKPLLTSFQVCSKSKLIPGWLIIADPARGSTTFWSFPAPLTIETTGKYELVIKIKIKDCRYDSRLCGYS